MKTFKLHLIRHGMTAGNLQGLYIGLSLIHILQGPHHRAAGVTVRSNNHLNVELLRHLCHLYLDLACLDKGCGFFHLLPGLSLIHIFLPGTMRRSCSESAGSSWRSFSVRRLRSTPTVSYTHLDVYKRQS